MSVEVPEFVDVIEECGDCHGRGYIDWPTFITTFCYPCRGAGHFHRKRETTEQLSLIEQETS